MTGPLRHTYHGSQPVRLNKWMAELGLCSRREADALIVQGGVMVDELQVTQPGQKIETGQTLTLSADTASAIAQKFTAILNKPIGYVSAQPEADQIPAVRLLTRANAADRAKGPHPNMRLAPLGRLDMDSRGLLILSEDGVLAKAIIGPHHSLDKEYIVTVKGDINAGRLTLLRNGLSLDGRRLKPAQITHEGDQTLRFILKEGRKRQIRRMCALVGLHVVDLRRLRIGPLQLDDLPEGQWRIMTSDERKALISASLTPQKGQKVAREDRPRAPAKARRAPRKPHKDAAALTHSKAETKRSHKSSDAPPSQRTASREDDRPRASDTEPVFKRGQNDRQRRSANGPKQASFVREKAGQGTRSRKPRSPGKPGPGRRD